MSLKTFQQETRFRQSTQDMWDKFVKTITIAHMHEFSLLLMEVGMGKRLTCKSESFNDTLLDCYKTVQLQQKNGRN